MADRDNDMVAIPQEWPEARPYLARYLEERRGNIEMRLEALERTDQAILTELGAVHESVSKLHSIHMDTAEKYGALVNFQGVQIAEQRQRWSDYDEEQKAQGELLRDGYKIVCREDKLRNISRIATLVLLFLIMFAMVVEKVM